MIDTLLKQDLPKAYGFQRQNVSLRHRQETGIFELGDTVACDSCKRSFANRKACNERCMRVDATDTTITVVEHEDYIKQFNGSRFATGGTCDLLMFDVEKHRKVVFCDLGCYSEQFVAKKQKKSHQQVCNSMSRLLKQKCGQTFINQFSEKILIFGRRDPIVDPAKVPVPSRDNVRGNMQSFIATPFSNAKYAVSHEVVEGIKVSFMVVNYPEPYIW